MLYFLIIILVILDQFTKYLISQNIMVGQIHPIIDGFFSLTNVRNTGGAFSLLAEQDWGIVLLSMISGIVSVVLIVILYRLRGKNFEWIRFAITLVASGTIGNMIDRIRLRSVLDFLMFRFGSYTFPIFNFADMCIVCGSILLSLLIFFDKRILAGSKNEDMQKVEANTTSTPVQSEDSVASATVLEKKETL